MLRYITLQRFALADAAEVFVILAGYTGGLVYSKILKQQGWYSAAGAVLRRIVVIYNAHILIFAISAGLIGYLSHDLPNTSSMIKEWRLESIAAHPFEALQEAVLLLYQPKHMDILPLYLALLTMLAAALPLLWRPKLLLCLSFTLYLSAQVYGMRSQGLPDDNPWMFNPFAWQLLFVIGAVFGSRLHGNLGRSIPVLWQLVAVCVVFLLTSRSIQFFHNNPQILLMAQAPEWIMRVVDGAGRFMPTDMSKISLHPLRLFSILALAYLFRFIMHDARWLCGHWAAPFVLMGQHSLVVFCVSIPLAAVAHVMLQWSGGWLVQLAVNIAQLLAIVGVAAFAAWLRPARKSPVLGINPSRIEPTKEVVL
jgi:hypothetical protein